MNLPNMVVPIGWDPGTNDSLPATAFSTRHVAASGIVKGFHIGAAAAVGLVGNTQRE